MLQKLDLSLQEMLCMPTKALNQLAGEAQLTTAELAELKVCHAARLLFEHERRVTNTAMVARDCTDMIDSFVCRLNEGEPKIGKRRRRYGGRRSSMWMICWTSLNRYARNCSSFPVGRVNFLLLLPRTTPR